MFEKAKLRDRLKLQKLDSIDAIPALRQVGRAVASRKVQEVHLDLAVFRP
jgi:hypothetical protein